MRRARVSPTARENISIDRSLDREIVLQARHFSFIHLKRFRTKGPNALRERDNLISGADAG